MWGSRRAAHVFRIHLRVAKSYSAVRPKLYIVMPSTTRGTRGTAKHEGIGNLREPIPLRHLERVDSPRCSPRASSPDRRRLLVQIASQPPGPGYQRVSLRGSVTFLVLPRLAVLARLGEEVTEAC